MVLAIAISVIAISACSSDSQIAIFYPLSGSMGGNVVQIKPQASPYKFPVGSRDIKKISIVLYQVDKDSFYRNSRGGFAGFEGHLDLSKFNQITQIFQGEVKVFKNSEFRDNLNGYIELPINNSGYYYLTFETSKLLTSTEIDSHILLEVNEKPTQFNYN